MNLGPEGRESNGDIATGARMPPLTQLPVVSAAGSDAGHRVRVEQKWGFGMAPVKPETAAKRQAAAGRLLAYVSEGTGAPLGRLEQLATDIPQVKGLFLGCPMIPGHEFWVFQATSWGLLWRSRISCGVLYPSPE